LFHVHENYHLSHDHGLVTLKAPLHPPALSQASNFAGFRYFLSKEVDSFPLSRPYRDFIALEGNETIKTQMSLENLTISHCRFSSCSAPNQRLTP
jgi:hypothetical protein